jgi:hypothetical protein
MSPVSRQGARRYWLFKNSQETCLQGQRHTHDNREIRKVEVESQRALLLQAKKLRLFILGNQMLQNL